MLTITEIAKKLNPIFMTNDIKKAILFGSYAKNNATIESDVDLVVDTEITGFKFISLVNEMREVLNKDVDLIPKRCIVVGSPIEYEINSGGVVIYEKS